MNRTEKLFQVISHDRTTLLYCYAGSIPEAVEHAQRVIERKAGRVDLVARISNYGRTTQAHNDRSILPIHEAIARAGERIDLQALRRAGRA